MRIIITGALGHIGSRLIRTLPTRIPGAEFVLVDDLSSQRYCSLFDLPHDVDYRFVQADILEDDPAEWLAGADVCVHLAAITDAASSFERPEEVEAVNLTGVERVAHACVAHDVALLFLSTTSVYGPQGEEVDEECGEEELAPQSPYAKAKLNAERRLAELAADGLRYVVFRFGTIFGVSPGMRFHTAVNKFCWSATLGEPLTVWRTAYNQRRPYLDLEDGVRAIAFAIEQDLFDNSVYNVATANLTVGDIVETIRAVLPGTRIQHVDAEIMNQHSYSVSSERIARRGFQPRGDAAEGIRRTLDLLAGLRAPAAKEPTSTDAHDQKATP